MGLFDPGELSLIASCFMAFLSAAYYVEGNALFAAANLLIAVFLFAVGVYAWKNGHEIDPDTNSNDQEEILSRVVTVSGTYDGKRETCDFQMLPDRPTDLAKHNAKRIAEEYGWEDVEVEDCKLETHV